MDTNDVIRQMILDRIDRLERNITNESEKQNKRLEAIEKKVNWALGFATAAGAFFTFAGQKLYQLLFGA